MILLKYSVLTQIRQNVFKVNAFNVIIPIWRLLILSWMITSALMIVHKVIMNLLQTGLRTVDGKLEMEESKKIEVVSNFPETIIKLNELISIIRKRVQLKYYLNENLNGNELLLLVNFSEKYKNKQQNEIQSGYFRQSCYSLLLLKINLKRPFKRISNSCYWVNRSLQSDFFFQRIYSFFIFQRKKSAFILKLNLHAWSDGCSA